MRKAIRDFERVDQYQLRRLFPGELCQIAHDMRHGAGSLLVHPAPMGVIAHIKNIVEVIVEMAPVLVTVVNNLPGRPGREWLMKPGVPAVRSDHRAVVGDNGRISRKSQLFGKGINRVPLPARGQDDLCALLCRPFDGGGIGWANIVVAAEQEYRPDQWRQVCRFGSK